ncbi:MAG: hypothetical protein NC930_07325, partial [Candidatus Omnitrophica bacterium]|nr:hypothetical protein [Candidatus Omnitrophota bacterium]
LLACYREKQLSGEELDQSIERIERLKQKRPRCFKPSEPLSAHPEGPSVAAAIAREAIVTSVNRAKMQNNIIGDRSVAVIFPKISALNQQFAVESELLNEQLFLEDELEARGVRPETITIVGLEPSDYEIEQARVCTMTADRTILFCYDAQVSVGNRKLLETVESSARGLIVVLLRDPWDEALVKAGIPCIQAYGFRAVQLRAVLDLIFLSAHNE